MGIFYRNDGVVTVFLSLILLPLLVFSGLTVDAARVYGAKSILEDSAKLSMNTIMTEYNRALKDAYGILAISKNEEELNQNLLKYFEKNINNEAYAEKNDNLIDIKVENMSVKGLENTQIFHPYVTKRQILEYMKYRGFLSIGGNFLEKLNVFREVPKQQKVISSKAEYESELGRIQEECEKIYDFIKNYEEISKKIEKYEPMGFYEDYVNGTDDHFGITDINRLIFSLYRNKEFCIDYTDMGEEQSTVSYQTIKYFFYNECLGNDIFKNLIKPNENNNVEQIVLYYFKINSNINLFIKLIQYFNSLPDAFISYKEELLKEYSDLENIDDIINSAMEEYHNLYNSMEEFNSEAKRYVASFLNMQTDVSKIIDVHVNKLNRNLNDKYNMILEMKSNLDSSKVHLYILLEDCLKSVGEKADILKDDIAGLKDGNVKISMEQEYKRIADKFDRASIKEFILKIENNIDYLDRLLKILDSVEYLENKYISEINSLSVEKIDTNYDASSKNYDISIEKSDKIANVYLKNFNFDSLKGIKKIDISTEKFYKYLKKSFKYKNDKEKFENRKQEAELKKENVSKAVEHIFNKYKQENSKIENNDKINIPNEGNIYEDFATAILKALPNESVKKEEFVEQGNNLNSSKEIAKQQANMMSEAMKAIDGLVDFSENLSGEIVEAILLTEYFTEMLSMRTTTENIDLNLAGNVFSKADNYIFGSELEYILWGNIGENTSLNSIFTTSSIYGIRFILNTIYAYTDSEINSITLSLATALAGFTGFGIPIVQNVLIMSLAMGESALDMTRLLNGECVELFKTSSTWVLKPSGISKEFVEKNLKEMINYSMENVTDAIIDLATEHSDKKMKKLEQAFEIYSMNLANNLSNEITNLLLTPIRTEIESIIELSSFETEKFIDNISENTYIKLKNSINSEPDSFGKHIKLLAIEYFIKYKLDNIRNDIKNIYNSIQSEYDNFEHEIQMKIKTYVKEISNEVKAIIFDNGYEKLKNDTIKSFKNISGDVRREINKKIDEFSANISSNSLVGGNNILTNTNVPSSFGMNYKEYLKVFILSGILAGKEEVYISRLIDIIKLNLVCAEKPKDINFSVKNTFTMLELDSEISVKTTFLRKNNSDKKNNRFNIKFKNIGGY